MPHWLASSGVAKTLQRNVVALPESFVTLFSATSARAVAAGNRFR